MRRLLQRDDGFTLVELLVVILILGILVAIAVPTFLNQQSKAQDAKAMTSLSTAYENAAADSVNNDGNFLTATATAPATNFVSELQTDEPELAPVAAAATPADVTTKGTLYVVSGTTVGATDLTGGGNFEAAIISDSGNLCTLQVTGHKAPITGCSSDTSDTSGNGSGDDGTGGNGSGDDGSGGNGSGDDGSGGNGSGGNGSGSTGTGITYDQVDPNAGNYAVSGGQANLTDYNTNSGSYAYGAGTSTSSCPYGDSAVGGAFHAMGSPVDQYASTDAPTSAGSSWTLAATGGGGFNDSIICVAFDSGDTQVVQGTTLTSAGKGWTLSSGAHTAVATCPSGYVIAGGGYQIGNDGDTTGSRYGTANYPSSYSGWTVSMNLDSSNDETLTAYAVCISAPVGYEIVPSSPVTSGHDASVWCGGQYGVALDGGYQVTEASGATGNLADPHTITNSDSSGAQSWSADFTGATGQQLTTYVVCADWPDLYNN